VAGGVGINGGVNTKLMTACADFLEVGK